ncbi:MAG: succinate dehydrogenase cytochrome b subunit [Acidimicrobiia bacterium]|nr:succinate dehydrogenase cytochrome b subunit [Acidimicrobiia bacterium]
MTATRTTPRSSRLWFLSSMRSSVGKKWAMALSGIALLGFIVSHLLGNLKIYFGPEQINDYGEALRDLGGHLAPRTHVLWAVRFGLAAAFAIHIIAAVLISLENRNKRGERYQHRPDYHYVTYASRTMLWSGIIVAAFVLFHLADLTWGNANPDFVRGDVYSNLVVSFERVPVAALYIVANLALGLHIYHGMWSLFRTMGVANPRFNQLRRMLALGTTAAITVGNLSFPIMVQAGVIS